MLSGRRRGELAATAAHEYTHLWINENRPDDAPMDPDAVEAICELAAYQLMGAERQPEMQKKILDNPYTHGKTAEMVALAEQRGMAFILNWVKNGTTTSPEAARAFAQGCAARLRRAPFAGVASPEEAVLERQA